MTRRPPCPTRTDTLFPYAARAPSLAPGRAYDGLGGMLDGERGRDDGIQAVAIATPNDSHFAIAKAALDAGLPVICDKPMTATLDEAEALAGIVAASGRPFALPYTYTGYAMVREARARSAAGATGRGRQKARARNVWGKREDEETSVGAAARKNKQ